MTRYLLLFLCLLFLNIAARSQNAYITNRGDSSISVINTATNIVIATIPVKPHPSAVVVSPDASRVYVSYYNSLENAVTGIYTNTNTVFGEVSLNTGATFGGVLDISPDGAKVYVGCNDLVFGIDAFAMKVTDTIATEKGNSIQGLAVSNDGSKLYVNGFHKIIVLDAVEDTVIKKIPVSDANFLQLAISPDNTKIYGADKLTGYLHATSLTTEATVDIKVAQQSANCVCISSDGSRVYTSNYRDGTIAVVDGHTDALLTTLNVTGKNPFGISLMPDDSKLYVANFASNSVNVVNTSTYEIAASVAVGKNPAALGRFIGGYSAIFPVTLSHFSAALYNHNISLQWNTENETNLSYFSVERSNDKTHFAAIGKVNAKGNATTEQAYLFKDESFAGNGNTLYYRLRMVDKNGHATLSSIVPVSLPSSSAISISIHPNPVKDFVTLNMDGYNGKALIIITDMSGKKWFAEKKLITNGMTLPVYTAALPPGTYTLSITTTGASYEKKFIKE